MKITEYSQTGFTVINEDKEERFAIKDHVAIKTKYKYYVGTLRMCESTGLTVTCNNKSSVAPGCYTIPKGAIVSITKLK